MPRFAPSHCGLDISDLVLRVAVIQERRQVNTLRAWQEILLPEGLIVEGEIHHPQEVAERLTVLLRRAIPSPIRIKRVIAGLPDRRTFVKLIRHSDNGRRQSLKTIVDQELEENIPFAPNEVYYDWQAAPSVNKDEQAVVVGAAPRSLVDTYLEVIERAGLSVVALEMESIALARAIIPVALPSEAQLIVDIGGTRTTVVGLGRQTVLFTSSLPFSGTQMTRAIAQALHLSFTDAERLKTLYGLLREKGRGAVLRTVQHLIPELVQHLRDLMNFSANHFADVGSVKHIRLSGGGAQLIGLTEELATLLKVPVSIGSPQVSLDTHFPLSRLPSFATAIGLALHPL